MKTQQKERRAMTITLVRTNKETHTGFIMGDQGMAISPAMLNAIRQDILTSGISSKWADEHEIKALATALGIQIKIINAPGGDQTYGSSGDLYQLLYNGRDHYNARVPRGRSYEDRMISGNGDCFYNSIAEIREAYTRTKPSALSLRQQVSQQLTNQNIADIAVALVRDFKRGQTMGIGQSFINLMRQRNPGQGDLYKA